MQHADLQETNGVDVASMKEHFINVSNEMFFGILSLGSAGMALGSFLVMRPEASNAGNSASSAAKASKEFGRDGPTVVFQLENH